MKFLIVHAHPEPASFSTALKVTAIEELAHQGHEVQTSDLYAMHFNPVASAADFLQRVNPEYCNYALEQRHASKQNTFATDIQQEIDKLIWCDVLILNFPIYWCSAPAILKGWIDRVFVSGVVYGGKRFYDRGGLGGKQALVSVTLGGQEHMFSKDGIHGPLNDMLKHLLQGTLGYAGFQVHEPFVGWHVPYITNLERRTILESWRSRLQGLQSNRYLPMPTLNEFDAQLNPIRAEKETTS